MEHQIQWPKDRVLLLSICIPIYNQDVGILVSRLLSQIEDRKNEVDILLIDDCSETHFKDLNKRFTDQVQYIELGRNVGRSKVRNQFLKHSNSEGSNQNPSSVFLNFNFIPIRPVGDSRAGSHGLVGIPLTRGRPVRCLARGGSARPPAASTRRGTCNDIAWVNAA